MKRQGTAGFWPSFLCLFRQRAVQGPEGQKFHLQCTLHCLKRDFCPRNPHQCWTGRLSELVKGIRSRLTSCVQGLSNSWGMRGGGGRQDLNGDPGDRRKEAPPVIKGPGRNRGSGAALSPMAAIHSPACSAKSSPTTTSSGPSGEGGTTSGSVPITHRDS